MAKPRPTTFTEEFEPILVDTWGMYQEQLDGSILQKTRAAAKKLRRLYTFKESPFPSLLDFGEPAYRAGYLAAFGQRHAYLAYAHLQQVKAQSPNAIPQPDAAGELTVTVLGAAAAIEVYGLILFYNETAHKLKRLNLNLVEKVAAWKSTRNLVLHALKKKFPKLEILQNDIDADLTQENCIGRFGSYHDDLVKTRILLIYNVLNEIETQFRHMVLRHMNYVIQQRQEPLLVLLAEPTAVKAWPRVNWFRQYLLKCSKVLAYNPNAVISFTEEPTRIAFEGTGTGLNDRLFGKAGDATRPLLQTSLKRVMMACLIDPLSPLSRAVVYDQIGRLDRKRSGKGRFAPQTRDGVRQIPMPGIYPPTNESGTHSA